MEERRHAREKAFQVLYQLDINQDASLESMYEAVDEDISQYAKSLIQGVVEKRGIIDKQLDEKLENWSLNRIGTVEKTVLRIALFEIIYIEDVPSKVAINEAVEIAKRFNEDKSGKFINGVLSKFMQE
ncbi:transcription antitermination factor NusB [Aquisalibacillus elongatus]|uniref:Transcription antitermination protein NusB n=1 Tax=Aquisalibacillus elongatus TaxID=485577 RepID=A0A3N5BD71_9BACI|nr:transcription antitermination factor NusB [Aquisalibacillus elongatus]RPF55666.1 NusB antitermination factor [Aquisalibacillus elongatus]